MSANVLSQLAPAASVETVLYTVPTSNKAQISELVICNRSASPNSFRVSISKLGSATATKDYFYYDTPIAGNDVFATEIDVTLNSFDVIRVVDTNGTLTFSLLGAAV